MEEMKNNVYKDVLFELRMFHCVDTNNEDVISLVNQYIDESYDSYHTLITPDNTNALVMEVVDNVTEDLHDIAILKSQNMDYSFLLFPHSSSKE